MTPIITIIIILAAAALTILLKNEKQIRLSSLFLAVLGGATVFAMVLPILFGFSMSWSDSVWLFDNFSALMASLVAFVYASAAVVSFRYIGHEHEEGILSLNDLKLYFGLFHIFALCMIITVLANNTLLLWMALEGTTLSSTFLVGLYRKKTSAEAAWKYIIICSTGISLGLLGVLLFGYASSLTGVSGSEIFTLTSLFQNAHLISVDIVKWAFVFLFVGFGAKLGLVPMHIWLPDAHSNAPSPISGMFSGILLNIALYGIIRFRFVSDLALGSDQWTGQLFLFFGVISILVPAFMMLVQSNYKRMLAYSSVEHMGIITFALSLPGIGAIAAVIHMIGHTLTKSMLFFGAGEILLNYKTTKTANIKALAKRAPFTAVMFLLGILAIIALPPSVLFVSEYTMFVTAFAVHPIISLLILSSLSVIAYAMLRSTMGMLFSEEDSSTNHQSIREKWNITHSVMVLQLLLVVGLTFFFSSDNGLEFIDSVAKDTIYISK
ncbi:MAG: Hydrogenase, membrane subunit 1-like protein (EchA-like) [Candidatus Moranbacteria bacterium GW2011_GWE1_36_7]|nr:MAG: Hydrogenase, membrane subunit 1-like protein (EchA-like) [Candidatus Moranbacteria bacterium GW2011_GWD2_36_12]KKQ06873.1 MAG: Hydrogenase, membrane subunit 1-like protein (EchA-like) [Candidatus Moranbacteria bacterium GW2011_GWE2_36_40]KKQ13725.1 MAG: Hydrogenase, membrane subunit 1-like protein (EchA-like) [Candidatus Moranbacteria bacterium GW2011_GWE1_36_7]